MHHRSILLPALLVLTGCAGHLSRAESGLEPQPNVNESSAEMAQLPNATPLVPAADREAILAMAGEYVVTFAFDETVVLQPDYEPAAPKRSGASEVVVVVENEPEHIVLQHLLLVGGENGPEVIKHWRQDWTFEASHRLEFLDDQTWRKMPLDPDLTEGAWTQCVYEVADAPRYCGTGRWNHRYGHATWTSDRSWRPLPRRDYTTRDDYTALNVENRHTITPSGWTHEQDNSKVVRVDGKTEKVLVREFGFNNYITTDEVDFGLAYEYWVQTQEYWATVRDIWQQYFDRGGVVLNTEIDGMPIIEGLFELAEQVREGDLPQQNDIQAVFDSWVQPVRERRQLAGQSAMTVD